MISRMDFYAAKLAYETDSWDLSQALRQGDGLVVVDTRSKEAYDTEHIPGAVNIPHRSMSPISTGGLDRSRTYVTYCDGIGCNGSTKGALKLAELGFQVKELLGGLDWWKRDGYATEGTDASPGADVSCGC